MVPYFGGEQFDREEDFPCRSLIKWIDNEKFIANDSNDDSDYEAQLKLYGYPYAVAFELIKVEAEQQIQVRRRIQTACQILFELSSLYVPQRVSQRLHNVQASFSSYE